MNPRLIESSASKPTKGKKPERCPLSGDLSDLDRPAKLLRRNLTPDELHQTIPDAPVVRAVWSTAMGMALSTGTGSPMVIVDMMPSAPPRIFRPVGSVFSCDPS